MKTRIKLEKPSRRKLASRIARVQQELSSAVFDSWARDTRINQLEQRIETLEGCIDRLIAISNNKESKTQ